MNNLDFKKQIAIYYIIILIVIFLIILILKWLKTY